MGRFRHQVQPERLAVTPDGLRRSQLAIEAQIVAAGAAGVTTFNTRSGAVSLLAADVKAVMPGHLEISIIDLPDADPSEPLLRWLFDDGLTFTGGTLNSGIAATSASSLRIRKNGAANGTISSAGVVTFTNLVYAPGDIFEIYPPAVTDATWDQVAIALETV